MKVGMGNCIAVAAEGSWKQMTKVFERLHLWMDPVRRTGPEAMAVDEWLLGHVKVPTLRVYGWSGAWGSIGYFGSILEAERQIRDVEWVRRWTGGGTVDHREDWTYSLVVPISEPMAALRGNENYRAIHSGLANVLRSEGLVVELSDGQVHGDSSLCFESPVSYDLVGDSGRKLAGAGQRRNAQGLLHQGSVAIQLGPEKSAKVAEKLAAEVSKKWKYESFEPQYERLAAIIGARYGNFSWIRKR